MLKKILIGVTAVVVLFVIVVATRPADFKIERSTTVLAPPAVVFAQVNDFHAWPAWSPWEKLDPGMKRQHSGEPSGTGAQYAWQGNDDVGEGKMTIEKSEPPSSIGIKLEFLKPFAATNDTVFTFAPSGAGTKVTWTMTGKNNFGAKAFSLFMNMDKLVGGDFEKGLAAMKAVSEKAAQPK